MSNASRSFKWHAAVLLSLPLTAFAGLNDWSKACTSGHCFYDLPSHKGQASGTIKIWGAADAISDITEAAGWTILDCDPDALKQDIRIVCTQPGGCDHLYSKNGPVNKIVRLPENCGKSAFARVDSEWDSEDQGIPQEVARKFAGQRGTAVPKVKSLRLDTDFGKIDAESGSVYFSLLGTTLPNAGQKVQLSPPASRYGKGLVKRDFWDWVNDLNNVDTSVSEALPPIAINHDWTLFSKNLSCAGFTGGVTTNAHVTAVALVTMGAAAVGTLVPPHIDEFGLYLAVDSATFQGTLHVGADVSGSVDTGVLTLFQSHLPSLSFHGIVSVSPAFNVLADVSGPVDLNGDLKIDLSYTVINAKLFFPPQGAPDSNGFFAPDGGLHLAVDPTVAGDSQVTAYISSQFSIHIDAMSEATADVALDLKATTDAGWALKPSSSSIVDGCVSADANLNIAASANANFFDLFNPSTSVTLFNHDFSLFKKCFGGATRRELADSAPRRHVERDLTCPASKPNRLVSLV